jgi:hypothetical protein
VKTKNPFAARVQLFNIYLLGISLLLLAQSFSYQLYRLGFVLLFIGVPCQIAIGNVKPEASRLEAIKKTLIYLAIVALIFALSIFVTPILIELGRNK